MNVSAWVPIAVGPVLILVLGWLMPSLAPPTLPFGVRVPPDRVDAAVIVEQRRRYRWWVGVAGTALLAGGLAVTASAGAYRPVPGILLPLAVLAVCLLGYLRARSAIRAVKRQEHWYEGLHEGAAVDTSLRFEPERYPWLWAMPALALLAGTVLAAVLRWPHLPPRLVVHIGPDGLPDRTVPTSVTSVAAPIVVQACVTAVLLLVVWLALRARPDIDPSAPRASARRYRGFSVRMARAILVLAACVNLSMLDLSWQMWSGGTLAVWPIVVPVLAGVIVLLAVSVTTGQLGGRLRDDTVEPATGLVHRDDDALWRGGMVYINRNDPALFVPKRFGVGWTVNFGNPRALLVIAAIALLALVGPVVAAVAGTR